MNFCKYKAWLVFAIIFGPAFVDVFIPFQSYWMIHTILQVLVVFSYLKWIYNVAQLLNEKQLFAKKNSWRFFQFNYLYFILYISIIYFLQKYNPIQYSDIAFQLLIFHLYASFTMLYFLYVIARNFECIRLRKDANFSEYFATFLAVWFLPIGIWWLQPKIRDIEQSG